jgi:LPXTG-motif cell wall-anchored protein
MTEATTSSATTVTLVQEEVPLADTGETLSWQLFAGIGMILVAGILVWKRQSAKA